MDLADTAAHRQVVACRRSLAPEWGIWTLIIGCAFISVALLAMSLVSPYRYFSLRFPRLAELPDALCLAFGALRHRDLDQRSVGVGLALAVAACVLVLVLALVAVVADRRWHRDERVLVDDASSIGLGSR